MRQLCISRSVSNVIHDSLGTKYKVINGMELLWRWHWKAQNQQWTWHKIFSSFNGSVNTLQRKVHFITTAYWQKYRGIPSIKYSKIIIRVLFSKTNIWLQHYWSTLITLLRKYNLFSPCIHKSVFFTFLA